MDQEKTPSLISAESRRISIRILRNDYESFVRAIPNEPRLPPTHEAWLKRTLRDDAKAVANSAIVQPVPIHYSTFAAYCTSIGQRMSYDLLEMLVAQVAEKYSDDHPFDGFGGTHDS